MEVLDRLVAKFSLIFFQEVRGMMEEVVQAISKYNSRFYISLSPSFARAVGGAVAPSLRWYQGGFCNSSFRHAGGCLLQPLGYTTLRSDLMIAKR